jgi:peptidyl-prolyl cis-trans isomerase C
VLAGWVLGGAGAVLAQPPAPPGGAPAAAAPAAAAQPAASTVEVAVVNKEKITLLELEEVLKQDAPVPVQLPEAQRRQRQFEALSLLIDNVLMRQFLEKNTPPVSPAEIAKNMAELEAGLKVQGKSLAEVCHDTRQTPEQLRASIAEHIRWSNYARARISDGAVAQYYLDNKDFFDNVTVHASHIVLRVPAEAPEAEKEKARARLRELRGEILAGKLDFAEAAKKYSQDPRAPQGGDLGFFPRKWVFDEPFARTAFALQPGQISDMVQTEYGLHLIKVHERKAGQPSDFNKIKEGVREFYAMDLRKQVLDQQRKAADIKITLP